MLQAKKVINCIYVNVNGKMPEDSASQFNLAELPQINSIPASRNFQKITPNATQHNIPAWTIFAMFFIDFCARNIRFFCVISTALGVEYIFLEMCKNT